MNHPLHHILEKHLAPDAFRWLEGKLASLDEDFKVRTFYLAFGACPRFVGKEELNFTESELSALNVAYPNFSATNWSADQLARVLFMTALPAQDNVRILDDLFGTADYRELIALYKGLYFLPNAADFVPRTREGLRTNMVGVFDAIALENPFPARYLSEDAWNHMVLKAMFMDRPMHRIYRIEERKNAKLADIFLDYADERRSAHRPVSPELWRFIDGFLSSRARAALELTARTGTPLEQTAARKALDPAAPAPSWNEIGRQATRLTN
ncbi:EboA domain-containing protein [Lewinella sp. JB7]|uniref:EboA domain-containing protein n=1 Tax=Lewinella sp. JB7 TaxID=2962887 RepID=UPI0020C96F0E|nr:EboA domain-containing protein [Lewinella sp. JB7]MCP9236118.1 EboA domain-containing protein [Lewinella sp. JB7]